MLLSLNIVTFIPEGKTRPRLLENEMLLKLLHQPGFIVNIFINSECDKSEITIDHSHLDLDYFAHVLGCDGAHSLGYARNKLMEEAISRGATHIINLDDDDYLYGIEQITHVINKFSDRFIYIQRWKDNDFFPSITGDTGSMVLQGKFISNGYACMVMPLELMIKYRLSFPTFIDTFEDNYFYMKLLMNYNEEFIFLANPYYVQATHAAGEFSMSVKTLCKIRQEEYQLINQITKFDSYAPKIRIVECHGRDVHELSKLELIKFCKLFHQNVSEMYPKLLFINGQFREMTDDWELVTLDGGLKVLTCNGVEYQIARINTLRDFLNYNSFYTTYRLLKEIPELAEAVKQRYFNRIDIPEKFMNYNIIMVTTWKKL